MRPLPLLLFALACCTDSSPPDTPTPTPPRSGTELKGRVLREDGPLAGARIKGRAAATVVGEASAKFYRLGPAVSGKDGSFTLELPPEFAKLIGKRTTWGWWIDLEAEDDEVLGNDSTTLSEPDDFESIVVRAGTPDPERPAEVRRLVEGIREWPLKEHFTYGMDALNFPVDDDEDNPIFELCIHADRSRAARNVLNEYEKDRDPKIRALAYAVLAGQNDCEDDVGRPEFPESRDGARRLLAWAFKAVATSKHGGHLAVGVDLDDLCARCYGVYEDASWAAMELGIEEARPILDDLGKGSGQPAILRRLVLSDLTPATRRDRHLLAARPEFPLPDAARIDGEAILIPGWPGVSLARPEREAKPVPLTPSWLTFDPEDVSADGARIIGRGGRTGASEIWVLDRSEGRGLRAGWDMNFTRARWLPDGRALTLRIRDTMREFRILDPETGATEKRYAVEGTVSSFHVGPEGKQAVFTGSGPSRKHRIGWVDLVHGTEERLRESGSRHPPRLSPDGRWVALVDKEALVLLEIATRKARTLVSLKSYLAPFAWSPDGDRIAYVEFPSWDDQDTGKGRLWMAPLDGAPPKLLAEFDSTLGANPPAWSPDGKWIAFSAPRNGKSWIYVSSAAGDTLYPVCPGGSLRYFRVEAALAWLPAPK